MLARRVQTRPGTSEIFFPLKFKRLALWQHFLSRNQVSVSRNLEISCECTWIVRGRFEIWKHSLHEASLAWLVIGEFSLCLRKKYRDLSNDYKYYVKALRLSFHLFSPENSIIASGEVNTILHLSPSACSMARRTHNTFIAHWIFPSKVNRNKNSRLHNLLFRTQNENTA